jgi:hypothetical protein
MNWGLNDQFGGHNKFVTIHNKQSHHRQSYAK